MADWGVGLDATTMKYLSLDKVEVVASIGFGELGCVVLILEGLTHFCSSSSYGFVADACGVFCWG